MKMNRRQLMTSAAGAALLSRINPAEALLYSGANLLKAMPKSILRFCIEVVIFRS